MSKILYIVLAIAMIGGGYYLEFVHSSVPEAERMACEEGYKQQFADQPDIAEKFIDQCRNEATILAGRANAGGMGAEEAAEQIATANRNSLIKTLIAYLLIGGGIGSLGAAFMRKK